MDNRDAVFHFVVAKFVVGIDKNRNDSFECLYVARKASAPPSERGDIVAQIGVNALDSESVALVAHISDVISVKNNIQIARKTIRAVFERGWRVVRDFLEAPRFLVAGHRITYDLAWLPAHHSHQINIFACFRARFAPDKPIKLIKFISSTRLWNF